MRFLQTVLIPFCLLIITTFSYCQDSSDVLFKGLRSEYVSANDFNPPKDTTVKSIIVVDNRPDTFRIGLYKRGWLEARYMSRGESDVQILLTKGENLQRLFKLFISGDSAKDSLLIIVNHLFITNWNFAQPNIKEAAEKANYYTCNLTLQAKIYVKKGFYFQGLVKIDTIFSSGRNAENSYKNILEDALHYTSDAISHALDENRFVNHPKLSAMLIDSINKPPYAHIFSNRTDSGYYLTYDDFLSERLTPASFEMDKLEDGCYCVYSTEKDGTQVLTRNIWGVLKGNKTYIMCNGLLFPLIKNNNGYYWKGLFKYRNAGTILPLVLPMSGGGAYVTYFRLNKKLKMDYVPCLLNMQTGVRY